MSTVAILSLLRRFGPYIAVALACLGFFLWVHKMQSTIASQRAEIVAADKKASDAQAAAAAEALARKADVAGLTALSQGLAAAAVDTKHDATILTETIDAKNPAPASAGLSDFLGRLRAADSAAGVHAATAGSGAVAAAAAAGASHR